MKKFLALSLLLFFVVCNLYFFTSCNNGKDVKVEAATSTDDSLQKVLARGEYLAHNVTSCLDCHSKRDITKFSLPVIAGTEGGGSGFPFGKAEGVPGEVWAPNITPAALKDWTDDEIAKALIQGVNKKGDTLFPLMPYHSFSRMAKEDIYSIIAYIRTLKPIDSTVPPRKLLIPASMFGPLPNNDIAENIKPDTSDKIKYGKYVVTIAACIECHTPRNQQGAPDFSKAFSGGFVFNTPFFKVGVANITPDSATGIGTWTEDAFVEKFRNNGSDANVSRNPGRMNSIMPWSMYSKMSETDLRAIYAFLRTVPPVSNKVEKYPK